MAVVAVEVPIAEAVAVAEVAHTTAAVAVAAEVQLLPVVEAAEDADKKKEARASFFLVCCKHVLWIEQLV